MSSLNSTTVIPSATFESIAVERGWITPAQVDECRGLHQTVVEMGLESTLAEVYVKKGYLSAQQSTLLQSALGKTGAVTIPGYEIIEKIAEGGMGAVYKARQISMDRLVGIKVLLQKFADDKDGRERFVREARAVAKLSHPNVVAGIDAGEAHGIYYFVMEFLDGESMDVVLRRRGRVPWQEATSIVRQVACALEHAQKHGIVHRDVKPGNIMLLRDGVAKLADLGLARVGSATDSTLTQSGMIVGSPAYLSPEQAVGDRELDVRSDIFSLGLTFFELIAGDRAFGNGNPMSTITALLTRNVPVDRLAEMDAPPSVIAVVAKMTWRDPGERYPTPQQLIEDLDALLAGRAPLHAIAPQPAARSGSYRVEPGSSAMNQPRQRAAGPQRWPKSRHIWIWVSVIVALLVAALLAYVNWSVTTQRSNVPLMMPTPTGDIEAAMDLRAAIGLAAEVVRDGTVYHAEFEHGEFSIDFAAGNHTINVVVDAVKGEVVKQLSEDEDHSLDVSSARIGLVEALDRAHKNSPGTAVEAQLLLLPGRVVIEVKIIRDGKPVWVAVNGATGEVSGESLKSLDTL